MNDSEQNKQEVISRVTEQPGVTVQPGQQEIAEAGTGTGPLVEEPVEQPGVTVQPGQQVDVAPEEKNELPIDTAGIITYNGDEMKIKKTTNDEFQKFQGTSIIIKGNELKNIVEEIKSIKLGGGSKKRSLKKNKKHHKNTKKHKRTKQRRHKGKNKTLRK